MSLFHLILFEFLAYFEFFKIIKRKHIIVYDTV
jgi:hypothetical protein